MMKGKTDVSNERNEQLGFTSDWIEFDSSSWKESFDAEEEARREKTNEISKSFHFHKEDKSTQNPKYSKKVLSQHDAVSTLLSRLLKDKNKYEDEAEPELKENYSKQHYTKSKERISSIHRTQLGSNDKNDIWRKQVLSPKSASKKALMPIISKIHGATDSTCSTTTVGEDLEDSDNDNQNQDENVSEISSSFVNELNLEDGMIMNRKSFICIGSTYYEENIEAAIQNCLLASSKIVEEEKEENFHNSLHVDNDQSKSINIDHKLSLIVARIRILVTKNSYKEALELLEEQVLLDVTEFYGPFHENTIYTIYTIGLVYLLSGSFPLARNYFLEALDNINQTNKNHSNELVLLNVYMKLSMIEYSLSNYKTAMIYLRNALISASLELQIGGSSPTSKSNKLQVSLVLNNMACLLYEMEAYCKSMELLQKSITLIRDNARQSLYASSSSSSLSRNELAFWESILECNMGFVSCKLNQMNEGISFLESSLSRLLLIKYHSNTYQAVFVMTLYDNLAFAQMLELQEECDNEVLDKVDSLYMELMKLQKKDEAKLYITWKKVVMISIRRKEFDKACFFGQKISSYLEDKEEFHEELLQIKLLLEKISK